MVEGLEGLKAFSVYLLDFKNVKFDESDIDVLGAWCKPHMTPCLAHSSGH